MPNFEIPSNLMLCCDGTIKNMTTGNVLKPYKQKFKRNKKGYMQISNSRQGVVKKYLVHRLIAKYFCIASEGQDCVNHIDGNKTNNNHDNLEWCTEKENKYHAKTNGLFQQSTNRFNASFDDCQILTIHTLKWPQAKIARHYKIAGSQISKIKNFKTYKNFAVLYE